MTRRGRRKGPRKLRGVSTSENGPSALKHFTFNFAGRTPVDELRLPLPAEDVYREHVPLKSLPWDSDDDEDEDLVAALETLFGLEARAENAGEPEDKDDFDTSQPLTPYPASEELETESADTFDESLVNLDPETLLHTLNCIATSTVEPQALSGDVGCGGAESLKHFEQDVGSASSSGIKQ